MNAEDLDGLRRHCRFADNESLSILPVPSALRVTGPPGLDPYPSLRGNSHRPCAPWDTRGAMPLTGRKKRGCASRFPARLDGYLMAEHLHVRSSSQRHPRRDRSSVCVASHRGGHPQFPTQPFGVRHRTNPCWSPACPQATVASAHLLQHPDQDHGTSTGQGLVRNHITSGGARAVEFPGPAMSAPARALAFRERPSAGDASLHPPVRTWPHCPLPGRTSGNDRMCGSGSPEMTHGITRLQEIGRDAITS